MVRSKRPITSKRKLDQQRINQSKLSLSGFAEAAGLPNSLKRSRMKDLGMVVGDAGAGVIIDSGTSAVDWFVVFVSFESEFSPRGCGEGR
jgi:hypothetical protein